MIEEVIAKEDWKLFLWVTMKYFELEREERVHILKGILLYLQFVRGIEKGMNS